MNLSERPFKGTILGMLLLVGLACLFFEPYILGDGMLFPVHTGTYPPWRDAAPPEAVAAWEAAANPLMADKLHMFHPEQVLDRRALDEGRLPLWDPHTLSGIPHLAQGMPGLFHLPNLPLLFMAPERAYAWVGLIQVALASIFMLLFLRSLSLGHFPATVGGLLFGYSGWMLVRLHYFMITGAAIWLPLLLLAVERLIRGGRAGWLLVFALGVCQTLCAGFFQVAVMNLYVAAAYALVRAAPGLIRDFRGHGKRLLLAGAGAALGLMLAGIQLAPTAATVLSGEVPRGLADAANAEHGIATLKERCLDPAGLAVYLAPDLFGHPDLTRETGSPVLKTSSLTHLALLPPLRSDVNYVELCGYVGVLPLLLALVAVFAGARRGWVFFAVLLVLGICLALGTPYLLDGAGKLPGLLIGDVKRFLFLAVLAFSVLAAFTLDAVWKPRGAPRAVIAGLLLAAVLATATSVAWLALHALDGDQVRDVAVKAIHANTGWSEGLISSGLTDEDLALHRGHLSTVLLRTLFHLALAMAALGLCLEKTRDLVISRPLLVAVLVLDLFSLGWSFNRPMPEGPAPLYDEANPVVRFLGEHLGNGRLIRFGDDRIYPVCAPSVHGLDDAQGYTAFYFDRYRRLWDLVEPGITMDYGTLLPEAARKPGFARARSHGREVRLGAHRGEHRTGKRDDFHGCRTGWRCGRPARYDTG